MNKKTINIITATVMLLAFFMPWIKIFGFGGSAYEGVIQVIKNLKYLDKDPSLLIVLFLLLFPFCSIIILIYYLKKEIKKGDIIILQFVKKAPLIFIIIITIAGLAKMGNNAKYIADSGISNIIGIGFILTLICSIIFFVDITKEVQSSLGVLGEEKTSEKADIDDLFN